MERKINRTQPHQKTIVVSAVNLNKGGTLKILRDCLAYLSALAAEGEYRVIAVVYQQKLADFPHIEYIETQWPKKSWVNRLWYEYVSLKKVSERLSPVYLWLSLHDTTPSVQAERQAVYCHNPFPFHQWRWREWFLTPKIVLLSLFSKSVYQKNLKRNKFVIVQQQWIKSAFIKMFGLAPQQVVIALPDKPTKVEIDLQKERKTAVPQFIYAAYYDSHKNFECLLQAAELLYKQGIHDFKVLVTLKGDENAYAKWLFEKWGHLPVLDFHGFVDRASLYERYAESLAMVFPSKVETWGLPITEFAALNKPMLLSDLPYAHETGAGSQQTAFFNPDKPEQLADMMKRLMQGDTSFLSKVPEKKLEEPVTHNWKELFDILLDGKVDENVDGR